MTKTGKAMQYQLTTTDNILNDQNGCVAIGIFEDAKLDQITQQIDDASKQRVSQLIEQGDFKAKAGNTRLLFNLPGLKSPRLLLVGLGKKAKFDEKNYQKAEQALAKALQTLSIKKFSNYLPTLDVKDRDGNWKIKQSIALFEQAYYQFTACKSDKGDTFVKPDQYTFAIPANDESASAQKAIKEAQAIALGTYLAKDLGNLPGNICTPRYLADKAIELANHYQSLQCKIHDEYAMKKMGMGALLSISQGSEEPAQLIELHYKGAGNEQPLMFVGKGVTFDSGGISIKPSADMDSMKYDMCGAATVLGAIKAVAELKLPINLSVIIPTTENLPSGTAIKPGDIVTSMSGQTIEITNTDAEGRMILCDALTFCEQFNPRAVIDVATLTGAILIALGTDTMGVFSNSDELAEKILAASHKSSEPAWRLPIWDNYQSGLDSKFADMVNSGSRNAGSILAACFLSRFCKKFPWAHLDIAGIGFTWGKEKQGTGRPVAALVQIAIDSCQK